MSDLEVGQPFPESEVTEEPQIWEEIELEPAREDEELKTGSFSKRSCMGPLAVSCKCRDKILISLPK